MYAPTLVEIQAKVVWRVSQSAPSRWVGVCDELSIATEGCSLDEMHSLIPETMGLLFDDLLTGNYLEAYLRDKGWSTNVPLPSNASEVEFDLPFNMITEGGRGHEYRT